LSSRDAWKNLASLSNGWYWLLVYCRKASIAETIKGGSQPFAYPRPSQWLRESEISCQMAFNDSRGRHAIAIFHHPGYLTGVRAL
jgi:hypothetical protein